MWQKQERVNKSVQEPVFQLGLNNHTCYLASSVHCLSKRNTSVLQVGPWRQGGKQNRPQRLEEKAGLLNLVLFSRLQSQSPPPNVL